MNKIITMDQAIDLIKDNDTLLIGGFLGVGTPEPIIDALVKSNKKNFTLVGSDTAFTDLGVGRLVVNKQIKKVIVTHIGTNKETGRQMSEKEIEVELIPQGTLVEKIRCAAYGLGGILTPIGIGTEIQNNKNIIIVDGKEYILEKALKGDVSLLKAQIADKAGNLYFEGVSQNLNYTMAGASKINIVYAEKVVEKGELDPNNVKVPGILINYIIDGGKYNG